MTPATTLSQATTTKATVMTDHGEGAETKSAATLVVEDEVF